MQVRVSNWHLVMSVLMMVSLLVLLLLWVKLLMIKQSAVDVEQTNASTSVQLNVIDHKKKKTLLIMKQFCLCLCWC